MNRQPRQHDEKHLAFIRQLPCIACGDNTSTEAAHIRFADRSIAKRETGMAEKPDDRFTVPLCGKHHREQHEMGNELQWWRDDLEIDPVKVALALYSVTGDHERGEQIVMASRESTR